MFIYENIILQKCCTDDLKKGGLSNKKVNGHTFVYVERYEIESASLLQTHTQTSILGDSNYKRCNYIF